MGAWNKILFGMLKKAQDYASNDGYANIIVTAIGPNHPYEFRMNINSGGSGYGQA